jgi:hypothetical protein
MRIENSPIFVQASCTYIEKNIEQFVKVDIEEGEETFFESISGFKQV